MCGPPGAGKSTVCQILAREHGFVYYEADSAVVMVNPLPDLHSDNPTFAGLTGKAVKVDKK